MSDHEFTPFDPGICCRCGNPKWMHRHDYIPSNLMDQLCWTCGKPVHDPLHSPRLPAEEPGNG